MASQKGKVSKLQCSCTNILITKSKWVGSNMDFINGKVEKHCSFSTLPKIIIINNYVKAKYSNNQFYKKELDANLNHNQMTRLHMNNNFRVVAWFLCIMILKRDVPRLSITSSKRAKIFI